MAGLDKVFAQLPEIDGAADEVRVVRVHVAEAFFGALAACDGLDDLAVKLAHAFLHGGFAQGFLALVMPRAQIEVLALPQFGDPSGALLLEILGVPAGHFDEVNRRDAVEAVQMADFVFEVFDKFPLAILALEIRRGKAGEEEARFAEALKDPLPPVLHAVDFLLIEERDEFTAVDAFKRGEVFLNAVDKLGDAALLVIAARVGDEEVVGHGASSGCGAEVGDDGLHGSRRVECFEDMGIRCLRQAGLADGARVFGSDHRWDGSMVWVWLARELAGRNRRGGRDGQSGQDGRDGPRGRRR